MRLREIGARGKIWWRHTGCAIELCRTRGKPPGLGFDIQTNHLAEGLPQSGGNGSGPAVADRAAVEPRDREETGRRAAQEHFSRASHVVHSQVAMDERDAE